MTDEQNLVRWSEALAGIARTGLAFTENLYERERTKKFLMWQLTFSRIICGGSTREEDRRMDAFS